MDDIYHITIPSLSPIWKAIRCISEVLSLVSDVPRPSSRPPVPISEGKWDKLLFTVPP